MVSALNTLPPNVAIGTAQDATGNTLQVMATPEFLRAQAAMLDRVGGTVGFGSDDLAALSELEVSPGLVLALRMEMAALRAEVETLSTALAHVPRLAQIEQLKREVALIEDPAELVRYILTRFARLDSPTFTGTPKAPTAPQDTNTTQIATTAFYAGQASLVAPQPDGAAVPGTSLRFARADHVHPTDPTRQAKITPGTATGSRGGNAALTSLLTALATAGLVIDSTTT